MNKIIFVIAIIISTIQLLADYKPLTHSEIQEVLGSNVRSIYPLNGDWEKKTSDGTWQVTIPYTEYNTIETEYTTKLNIDKETLASKNVLLSFLGLSGDIELFINGSFLVKLIGECLPHTIPIPRNLLTVGSNSVGLRFLPPSDYHLSVLHSSIDHPRPFIGIIREAFVVFTERLYVKSVNQFPSDKQLKISVDLQSGTDVSGDYKVEWILRKDLSSDAPILHSSVLTNIESARVNNVIFHIQRDQLERWSPSHPVVYTLTLSVKKGDHLLDNYIIPIVNKSLTSDSHNIYLNSNRIKLLCMEYDEYFPGIGYTRSIASLRNDIKKLQLMGVNTLLFTYTNPSSMLLDICLKSGILVFVMHNTSCLPLSTEDLEFSRHQLENKLTTYANKSAISAIGINNILYRDKINKNKHLVFDITDNLSNTIDGIDFSIYNIASELSASKLECLRSNLTGSNVPVLLLAKSLYIGERLSEPQSTLHNRQSIRYKELFDLYESTDISGYIAEGFRDRLLAYPQFSSFNFNNSILKKGLIDSKGIDRHAASVIHQLYMVEKTPLLNEPEFEVCYSSLYLIISIVLLLLLVFLLKKDNKLLKVFQRSIRRGHNLYCDIRDNRISYSINIYLLYLIELLTISLSMSIFVDFSVYKSTFSHFLSLLFPFPSFLTLLNNIFYQQVFLLLTFFLLFSILSLLVILFLRLLFFIYRIKISLNGIFYLLTFILTPFLSLSIISVFLGKLLILSLAIYSIFIILLLFLIIGFIKRVIDGVGVIIDTTQVKSALLIVGSLLLFMVLPLYFYFNAFGTFPHLLHLLLG